MMLWFIRTSPPLGFVEVFKSRPVYNATKGAWVGRLIHPFSFRDAEALGMARWAPAQPHGFVLVPEARFSGDLADVSPWSFVRNGRGHVELHTFGMWTIEFCARTTKALDMDTWAVGDRMLLIEVL